MFQINEVIQ